MNAINKLVTVTTLCLIIAGPAMAGHTDRQRYCDDDWEDAIDQRLSRQQQRIERGIEEHSLCQKERRQLRKKHREIIRLSYKYQEDGDLSRNECQHLPRKLDRLSDRIREDKHNDLERYVIYHDRYAHKNKYW